LKTVISIKPSEVNIKKNYYLQLLAYKISETRRCITLCFGTHRIEHLPAVADLMAFHDMVILEEPYDPDFQALLNGKIPIDDYIAQGEFLFPRFQKRQYELLINLAADKKILQIDPYLEKLIAIHEFFADGGRPEDVSSADDRAVYEAEKSTTSALIRYYNFVIKAGFDDVVEAVIEFARRDAHRTLLRDRMRATAIASLLSSYNHSGVKVFVEAGYIHISIIKLLRKLLPDFHRFLFFPAYPVVGSACGKKHAYSPGDLLTLMCMFNQVNVVKNRALLRLLAARSIIYTKILKKDELEANESSLFPHTVDEIYCRKLVSALSYSDCAELFQKIRYKDSVEARRICEESIFAKRLSEKGDG